MKHFSALALANNIDQYEADHRYPTD